MVVVRAHLTLRWLAAATAHTGVQAVTAQPFVQRVAVTHRIGVTVVAHAAAVAGRTGSPRHGQTNKRRIVITVLVFRTGCGQPQGNILKPEGIEITVNRQRVIVRCPAVPVSLMAVLQVDRGLPVLEVLVERDGVQLLLTSREVIPVTGIEVLVHRHVIAFREAVTRKSDIRIHFIKTFGIAQTPGFPLLRLFSRNAGHGLGYISGNSTELIQVPAQPHCQGVVIPGNDTATVKRPLVADTPGCLTGSKDRAFRGVLIVTRTTGNQLVTNLARTGQIGHICRVHLERFFPPVLLDNFNIQAATHGAVQVLNGERTCRHGGVIEDASLLRNHDARIRIRNP